MNREMSKEINSKQEYEHPFPEEYFEDYADRLEVPNQGSKLVHSGYNCREMGLASFYPKTPGGDTV
jgi:hypothetical protein